MALLFASSCAQPTREGRDSSLHVIAFEGVVTNVLPSSDDFHLLPRVSLGDRFSGEYSYDLSSSRAIHPPDWQGEHRWDFPAQASAGIAIEINGARYAYTNSEPSRLPFNIVTAFHPDPTTGRVIARYNVQYLGGSNAGTSTISNQALIGLYWEQGALPEDPLALPELATLTANQFFLTLRYVAEPNWGPPIASSRFSGKITRLVRVGRKRR